MIDRVIFYGLIVPGTPFANMLSRIWRMGDGTGNESSIIAHNFWSMFFGALVWTAATLAIIYCFKHMTISFH